MPEFAGTLSFEPAPGHPLPARPPARVDPHLARSRTGRRRTRVRHRWVWGCVAAMILAGCSALSYHELPGSTPKQERTGESRSRVVLIVVDGLRLDVLDNYMRSLQQSDYEPEWPSGLSRLRRGGFRVALSTLAEAPVPAYGMAAAAAVATGQFPGETGIPGNVWYAADPNGGLQSFNFESADNASQIFFDLEFALPRDGVSDRPLLSHLLRTPTMYERLAPTHRSAVVFHPFGAGARWLIPSRRGAAVTAVMRHRRAADVAPMFDRGARDGAIDVFLGDPLPDLVTVYFGGVALESCFQHSAVCSGAVGDLARLQAQTLRRIDGYLDKMFRKLAAAHPDAFAQTHVLMVSTSGAIDRSVGEAPDSTHVLTPESTVTQLAKHAPTKVCATWLGQAITNGELAVAANGGAALLYTRRAPRGRFRSRAEKLACLGDAIAGTLASDDWLSGAAWMDASQLGEPGPRGRYYQARLRPAFARSLSAQRRARVLRKLRLAVDSNRVTRTGDALLFASQPWLFVHSTHKQSLPYATQGGLEDGAMQVPFLIASRALSELFVAELRATPLEVTDVAPTVLALLDAPPSASEGLPRPSVVQWTDTGAGRQLDVLHADRQLPEHPAIRAEPRLIWLEGADHVVVGIEEPATVSEPDTVQIRLGDNGWKWTWGDAFGSAPCKYEESSQRRRWTCRASWPPSDPRSVVALAARRSPSSRVSDNDDNDDDDDASSDDLVAPILRHAGDLRFEGQGPTLICADENRLKLEVGTADDLGLAQVSVMIVSPAGVLGNARFPGTGLARQSLGRLELAPTCADAGFGIRQDCQYVASPGPGPRDVVEVPFRAAMLRHYEAATSFMAVGGQDRDRLCALFNAQCPPGSDQPPRSAYLAVRVCNLAGSCVQRPLLSDRDYWKRVEQGCP